MRLLLSMPVISKKVREKICQEVIKAFGGQLYEVIIGGAAFNQEVESFLQRIEFPYTVGYGATECAPIICYRDWHTFKQGSCGQAAYHMQVKINSSNPSEVPGEIFAKGLNTMLGYYKNPEATAETLDSEGWYHTGDLGTMDYDGNVFINGRSKNMLLGPSGQNIYPEEIEDKLNSMTMVVESVVVQRDNKLVGLVYPDYDEAKNMRFNDDDIKNIMEQNRIQLNELLPAYEKITEIEIRTEEFEKTPKRSIKRFLYT
jgi:long-chain acyl-CoA synthetase